MVMLGIELTGESPFHTVYLHGGCWVGVSGIFASSVSPPRYYQVDSIFVRGCF